MEEHNTLLAQAEALRLAIDDEYDYQRRMTALPPSLTDLLKLKRILQEALSESQDATVRRRVGTASPLPNGECDVGACEAVVCVSEGSGTSTSTSALASGLWAPD